MLTCTVGGAGWQWWWQRARTRGKGRTSGGRYCSATRTGRVLVFHHPQCQTLGKKMKTHKNPSKPHRFNLTCSDYRKDAAHWIVPVKDVLGERFQDLCVGFKVFRENLPSGLPLVQTQWNSRQGRNRWVWFGESRRRGKSTRLRRVSQNSGCCDQPENEVKLWIKLLCSFVSSRKTLSS